MYEQGPLPACIVQYPSHVHNLPAVGPGEVIAVLRNGTYCYNILGPHAKGLHGSEDFAKRGNFQGALLDTLCLLHAVDGCVRHNATLATTATYPTFSVSYRLQAWTVIKVLLRRPLLQLASAMFLGLLESGKPTNAVAAHLKTI